MHFFCLDVVGAVGAGGTAPDLQGAVASLRSDASCKPLHYDPVVEQAAEIINRLTDDYVNHTARQEPVADPVPGLKDLGYHGNKGTTLQGAAKDDAEEIKGMLRRGMGLFPDCSYTDFGISLRRNETTGYTFTSLVLAGP